MSFSLGGIRQWHWISGAVCLVGMMLFALTGITLNHAADIPANRTVTSAELSLPPLVVEQLVVVQLVVESFVVVPSASSIVVDKPSVFPFSFTIIIPYLTQR